MHTVWKKRESSQTDMSIKFVNRRSGIVSIPLTALHLIPDANEEGDMKCRGVHAVKREKARKAFFSCYQALKSFQKTCLMSRLPVRGFCIDNPPGKLLWGNHLILHH